MPNLNQPTKPTKEKKVSPELAHSAQLALAQNLRASTFWFTFCPEYQAAHIGTVPGLKCGLCDKYHKWLELSRDETKLLANKEIFDRISRFVDNNINRPIEM